MEPRIWMLRVNVKEHLHYDSTCVYVDELLIASKSPQTIADALINKCDFKLKGAGPTSFLLGCDLTRYGRNGILLAPLKNIDKTSNSHT